MVPGLLEHPVVLWGLLVVTLLVLAAGPPAYLHRYVPEATPGLVAGSYFATLVSLGAVPLLPLQYLARTGGLPVGASWLGVVAGYLGALVVATVLYAVVLRWRLGGVRMDRRLLVAVATLPATNLLFLLLAPALFVLAVSVGRIT